MYSQVKQVEFTESKIIERYAECLDICFGLKGFVADCLQYRAKARLEEVTSRLGDKFGYQIKIWYGYTNDGKPQAYSATDICTID